MSIRILIVARHEVFRRSLARFLAMLDASYEIVGEAVSDAHALEETARLRPDVVFVEVDLPRSDGFVTTRSIRAGWPGTIVIALNGHQEAEYRQAALDAGALVCVDKLMLVEQVPDALQAAVRALASPVPAAPLAIGGLAAGTT